MLLYSMLPAYIVHLHTPSAASLAG